jgi:hypothetical protein
MVMSQVLIFDEFSDFSSTWMDILDEIQANGNGTDIDL